MSGFADNEARDAAILAVQVENKSLRNALDKVTQELAAFKASRRPSTSSSRRPSLGSRTSSTDDWSARIAAMERQEPGRPVSIIGLVMVPTYTSDDLFGIPVTRECDPEPAIQVWAGGRLNWRRRELQASDFSLPEDVRTVTKALTTFKQYSQSDKRKADRMSDAFKSQYPTVLLLGDSGFRAKLGSKSAIPKHKA